MAIDDNGVGASRGRADANDQHTADNTNPRPSPRAKASTPEDYFAFNPPPPTLEPYTAQARSFIARHSSTGPSSAIQTTRPVVLITSGGTTVPLENQTVRFIDNFSAGTRGATSAEYFLKAGYAVIFLHRQYSLLPYSRHYSHSTNCFLDFMEFAHEPERDVTDGETDGTTAGGTVVVKAQYQARMSAVLREYGRAKRDGTLLLLAFTTINEYLWLLRRLAELMRPVGERALFYLAAAVSDFFVPSHRMVEHKIQSGAEFQAPHVRPAADDLPEDGDAAPSVPAAHMDRGSLVIDLDPVPKFLKQLVDGWAPSAMIVSFKLETDPSILTKKARGALEKYAHHLVIGNLLSTRKSEVVFVGREGSWWVRLPEGQQGERRGSTSAGEGGVEIESLIIPEVKRLHERFIAERSVVERGIADPKVTRSSRKAENFLALCLESDFAFLRYLLISGLERFIYFQDLESLS